MFRIDDYPSGYNRVDVNWMSRSANNLIMKSTYLEMKGLAYE